MAKSARNPRGVFGERITPSRPDRSTPTPPVFGTRWERSTSRPGGWEGFDNSAEPAPVFTSDPSLTGDAIVGSTLTVSIGTASNATSYAGSLRHVSDDTEVDTFTADGTYVIADTDFGESLYLHVTATGAGGNATAESAATGRVAETPVQTLGAQLAANDGFTDWTGGNPDGWTVTKSPPNSSVAENPADHCQIISDGTNVNLVQSILDSGELYEADADVPTVASGTIQLFIGTSVSQLTNVTAAGVRKLFQRADGADFGVKRLSGSSCDATLKSLGVKQVTRNAQLTAPSADMRLDFLYTLPGSPVNGTTVWLLPRISDFASGNYLLGWLRSTGSQWDINLYSVASHARTSLLSATNIGATNGLRFTGNGDQLSLWTTANGGANYTQRGSTVTNSTYQTATGVNVLYTSDITPGTLSFAPA